MAVSCKLMLVFLTVLCLSITFSVIEGRPSRTSYDDDLAYLEAAAAEVERDTRNFDTGLDDFNNESNGAADAERMSRLFGKCGRFWPWCGK